MKKSLKSKTKNVSIGLPLLGLSLIGSIFIFSCSQRIDQSTQLKQSSLDLSKLGIHTGLCHNTGTSPCSNAPLFSFVENNRPALMKVLDGVEKAHQIKFRSPSTKIIGRLYEANQWCQQSGNPITNANNWFEQFKEIILDSPAITYWEGCNEPDVSSVDRIQNIAEYEKERTRLLSSIGKRACIGNFSVGNPHVSPQEWENWNAFKPALQAIQSANGILCLHEYSNELNFHASMPWFLDRHTMVKSFLDHNGFSDIKIAITEFGFDTNGDPSEGGYQFHYNSDQHYVREIKNYANAIADRSYILGLALYQHGIPDWESFDVEPLLADLTQ